MHKDKYLGGGGVENEPYPGNGALSKSNATKNWPLRGRVSRGGGDDDT